MLKQWVKGTFMITKKRKGKEKNKEQEKKKKGEV